MLASSSALSPGNSKSMGKNSVIAALPTSAVDSKKVKPYASEYLE